MGTTQRISPGVPGQPNWGDLNKSITQIAKTVEKESEKEQDNGSTKPEQAAAAYKKLYDKRDYHIRSVYKNLVKTGGGTKKITSGNSNSIGRAGLSSTRKLVRFFSEVRSGGLQHALNAIGFGNLSGKSMRDVIDFLLVYCSESNTGMDETAANKASCEVLNEIANEAMDFADFEKLLRDYVDGKGLSDLLCKFWGHYIFEHLSQRFQEKVTQQRGEPISTETFKIIKDDIMGRISVLNDSRAVSTIDWKGPEGEGKIEEMFDSIIKIIYDENND